MSKLEHLLMPDRGPITVAPLAERANLGGALTAWCPTCEERAVPMRNGACGFCDTKLDVPAPPARGNASFRTWNSERIIDAIYQWAADAGQPPSSSDWNPALARRHAEKALGKAREWHERIRRFETGSYPSVNTVREEFGSFSAALEAAGIESRPAGRTPRTLTATQQQQLSAAKPEVAGPAQLVTSLRAVKGAQAAKNRDALRSALFDLAAVAMAWCEQLNTGDAA